ncbi:hypothetical protein MPSEU_000174100 [Mayamaea pseudoterrestris]|nr:hypothetical protein MPSEU_000174100 [Mayamaea pseudoterrestris]
MMVKHKTRLKKRVVVTVLLVELVVFVCLRSFLLRSSNRRIESNDMISFVLYHDKTNFHSKCCLNNLLMSVIAGQIQQGCQLARQQANESNAAAAVLLPKDLDVGGALRLSSDTPFSMYSDEDIAALQRIAREQFHCRLFSEDEIAGSGIPKIHYDRPLDIAKSMQSRGPLHEWTYRHMVLPKSLALAYDTCYGNQTRHKNYLAVHLRIESDWYPYCEKRSLREDGVNACYTPTQIAASVSNLNYQTVVLLYGKVAWRHRNEMPQEIWPSMNPHQHAFHKSWSNHCTAALRNLSYNEVALLDFWVAIEATVFVGTHLSTFSNSVTYVREIRNKPNSSYVYSCPSNNDNDSDNNYPLMLRRDGGLLVRNASDRQRCYLPPEAPDDYLDGW